MKYFIDYQYLSKGDERPNDDGEILGIKANDSNGLVILPNVGDYVSIDNSCDGEERSSFYGRVCSRLFRYMRNSNADLFRNI